MEETTMKMSGSEKVKYAIFYAGDLSVPFGVVFLLVAIALGVVSGR